MTNACVFDIGSSSVRVLGVELSEDQKLNVFHNQGIITRLSEKLLSGNPLYPAAKTRTISALKKLIRQFPKPLPDKGVCIATQALRLASDSDQFCHELHSVMGYPVEILSTFREGELALKGSDDLISNNDILIDLGGGSTEWIWRGEDRQPVCNSFPFGAGSICRGIDLSNSLTSAEQELVQNEAKKSAETMVKNIAKPPEKLIVLGGTATTIAAIEYQIETYFPGCVHGKRISVKTMERIFDSLVDMDCAQRESSMGVESGRGNLIVTGTALLLQICLSMLVSGITISEHGIRFGRVVELLSEE